jgi:hypothetical protein
VTDVIDLPRKLTRSERFRRTVAGKTSGALAYTSLCVTMLLYAVLLEKMPDVVLAKVHALFG